MRNRAKNNVTVTNLEPKPVGIADRDYVDVLREVASSLENVFRSEVRLAKVEARETASHYSQQGIRAIIFGVIALAGALPLMAFLVIGLGILLNGNYWLSSLIVGVVFLAVGGGLLYRSIQHLKERDASLPLFRQSIHDQRETVNRKVGEVSEEVRHFPQGGRAA